MSEYFYTHDDLIKMQNRDFERKILVTQAKFLEFCTKTEWNVSLSVSGGADSTVLLDMFCKFWSGSKAQHGDKPILAIYANTSNEFASMPKHVKYLSGWMEEKHGVKIQLEEVRADRSYRDVIREEGYPVVSKKVSRMIRDVRTFLKHKYGSVSKFEELIAFLPQNINEETEKRKKTRIEDRIKSADKFRELGFPPTVVLRLTGITQANRFSQSWSIPKKWIKLITAPFDVSDQCCDILKKAPLKIVQKASNANPIFGTLAEDSEMRREAYLQTGCNAFKSSGQSTSTPMGFWLRQDVLRYIHDFELPIAPPYGELVRHEDGLFEFTGEHNTGCKLCLFGCHLENNPNRIQRLASIEPATYMWAMKSREDGGLGYTTVMEYCGMEWSAQPDAAYGVQKR